MLGWLTIGMIWSPRFINWLHNRELEVEVLFGRLYVHSFSMGIEDSIVCSVTKNGSFLYKSINSCQIGG